MRNGVRTVINGFIFTLATNKYVTSSQGVCNYVNIFCPYYFSREDILSPCFSFFFSDISMFVMRKTNDSPDEITNIVTNYS